MLNRHGTNYTHQPGRVEVNDYERAPRCFIMIKRPPSPVCGMTHLINNCASVDEWVNL
jgi:hypothetical protein